MLAATGYGVSLCARRAAQKYGLDQKSPRVVIQGLGQVGSVVASSLSEAGFTVVGVSDSHGGVYNKDGLDIARLQEYIDSTGSIKGFTGGEYVTNEALLELECDILAPCAVANVIDAENAPKLKCKIVVEGANSPVTPDADNILASRKILVVPDVVANASGVTAGYFEWVQGLMRLLWSEEEVYQRLEKLVNRACDRMFERADQTGADLRTAAISLAVERIFEARRLRGLYP